MDIGWVHPWVGGWVVLGRVEFLASVVDWVGFNDNVTVGSNDCVLFILVRRL